MADVVVGVPNHSPFRRMYKTKILFIAILLFILSIFISSKSVFAVTPTSDFPNGDVNGGSYALVAKRGTTTGYNSTVNQPDTYLQIATDPDNTTSRLSITLEGFCYPKNGRPAPYSIAELSGRSDSGALWTREGDNRGCNGYKGWDLVFENVIPGKKNVDYNEQFRTLQLHIYRADSKSGNLLFRVHVRTQSGASLNPLVSWGPDQSFGLWGQGTYNLKFQPDCSYKSSDFYLFTWNDADSGAANNSGQKVSFKLWNDTTRRVVWSDSNAGGDGTNYQKKTTILSGNTYNWQWSGISAAASSTGNGIGFQLPFGGISMAYNYKYCVDPSLAPSTSVDKSSVAKGSAVTFTHKAQNKSGYNVKYAYRWRRYIIPPAAGRTITQVQTAINKDIYSAPYSGDIDYASSVVTCSSVGPSAYCPSSLKDAYNVPSSLATGSFICENLHLDDVFANGNEFPSIVPTSGAVCSIVTDSPSIVTNYYPYFIAKNSGVWSGGDYSDVGSDCKNDGVLAGWYDNQNTPYKGSGADLAAVATGKIVGFASRQQAGTPSVMELTFANTTNGPSTSDTSPDLGGEYGAAKCLTDFSVPDNATSLGSASSITPSSLGDGSKVGSGPVTVNGGTISSGQHVSLYINGDVLINGDIKYATGVSIDTLPSFVLRATGNIYISNSVKQLDGAYIAHPDSDKKKGSIYTCATSAAQPGNFGTNGFDDCNNQLVVNGVFIASKINLLRTFGDINDPTTGNQCTRKQASVTKTNSSDISGTCAAEIFRLSPEIYLNGTSNSSNNPTVRYKYDYITNLPPIL
jgi:hypothetical protein